MIKAMGSVGNVRPREAGGQLVARSHWMLDRGALMLTPAIVTRTRHQAILA
jgi:hypothetical protein